MDGKTFAYWVGFLILVYLILSFEQKNQGPSQIANNLVSLQGSNLIATLQGR